MTKAAAIHQFLNQFLPCYAASSVPDDVVFPYGTYELATGAWESGEVSMTLNLWYYSTGEKVPNDKVQELSEAIGMGGKLVPCSGGAIWLKRGSPWCQNLRDDADPQIKRRYINLTVEYLTLE